MSAYQVTNLEERPYFDLEGFMLMSHEKRIGGATLERLEQLWEAWSFALSVKIIEIGKVSYLVLWLPAEVEEQVEKVWKVSASEGFLVNNLAQYLCMSTIQLVLPEVEEGGCAPSPRPTENLRQALAELGVPYKSPSSALLALPYAVVTYYPYRGSCEICHLQAHCPKGQGKAEEASILLPGFEQSKD